MATWNATNKSSASWTPGTKSADPTWTGATHSTTQTLATAGLYYGFGCFTYSGGEVLSTNPVAWTATNKS